MVAGNISLPKRRSCKEAVSEEACRYRIFTCQQQAIHKFPILQTECLYCVYFTPRTEVEQLVNDYFSTTGFFFSLSPVRENGQVQDASGVNFSSGGEEFINHQMAVQRFRCCRHLFLPQEKRI